MRRLAVVASLTRACFSRALGLRISTLRRLTSRPVKVADGLYVLMGGAAQGNIVVSAGSDGIFMIVSMYGQMQKNGGAGGAAYCRWLGDGVTKHVAAIEMEGGAESGGLRTSSEPPLEPQRLAGQKPQHHQIGRLKRRPRNVRQILVAIHHVAAYHRPQLRDRDAQLFSGFRFRVLRLAGLGYLHSR